MSDTEKNKDNVKVWFFAGGETRDYKFNVFTGSFIRLMREILEKDFDYIKGIYYDMPMLNVMWALSHAQKPISNHYRTTLPEIAFRQMLSAGLSADTRLILVSSSTGSIVAAQTACYIAGMNCGKSIIKKPFHLALGASMISKESELFRSLEEYTRTGAIERFIYEDLQDEGDNTFGIGGKTRKEAYSNAFGLMFPALSRKFKGPSFLNTHPAHGHLHRKRSQTLRKALDYIEILLVRHNLAGEYYRQRAKEVLLNPEIQQHPVA